MAFGEQIFDERLPWDDEILWIKIQLNELLEIQKFTILMRLKTWKIKVKM